ncbi:MAG: DUF4129 domain-containing protein [Anaerolineae bacterium]|nr:DUF4129 domain-containing protein [Anaerolineae bacterium]
MKILLSWREKVIYPLIVTVMIGCCLLVSALAVERFAGSRLDLYIIALIGTLAALQSFYTQRLTNTLRISGIRRGIVYILELALLLVLARLGLFISDIVTGQVVSFDFFKIDLRWLFVITLMALAWWFARSAATHFSRLHSSPDLESEYIDSNWVSPYQAISSLFMWGGVMIMLFAGFARMDMGEFQYVGNPPVKGIIPIVMLYFGMGVILLGQARFDSIRRSWLVDRLKIAGHTGDRWLRYSLILIGLAALFACLIPVSYTIGLLESLNTVLSGFLFIIAFLLTLLVSVLNLIIYLVDLLFGRSETPEETPLPPPPEIQLTPTASSSGTWDWLGQIDWAGIQSSLSWLIAFAVIAYMGWTYLRDHPQFFQSLEAFGVYRLLARLWHAFWDSIVGAAEEAGEATRDAFQRLFRQRGSRRPLLSRLLRLGSSSPRERILALYLSTLHRAAGQGLGRQENQTPYEYEVVLEQHIPAAEPDITRITEAFVEARYSRHPVGENDAAAIRETWLRLRSTLRRPRSKP